jgi:hypothetical protein
VLRRDAKLGYIMAHSFDRCLSLASHAEHHLRAFVSGEAGGDFSMTCSLRELRAFAVRNRLDVTFRVRATDAAWMVNRRGLVARPSIGDATVSGVENTLEAADEFLVEGGQHPHRSLSREEFLGLMATRAAAAGAGRERDDE